MHDPVVAPAPNRKLSILSLTRIRGNLPTLAEVSLAAGSALLLILSFPDFDLWWLAWIGLVPLIVLIAGAQGAGRAFLLGLVWGTIFFYGSCWWLTYSMIHYGHLRPWLAYLLLLPTIVLVAIFPAMGCALLARIIRRFGSVAVIAAPFIWVAADWLRYSLTGQLWNSVGYSQAFHPALIQTARWGGVYAVGFLIVLVNTMLAYVLLKKTARALAVSLVCLFLPVVFFLVSTFLLATDLSSYVLTKPQAIVVAVQPNVPMDQTAQVTDNELLNRHLSLGLQSLKRLEETGMLDNAKELSLDSDSAKESAGALRAIPRLTIWPESPMNFSYSRDPHLQNIVGAFARTNHTSLLLNSLEPAPNDGSYNSAIMVNEEGRIVAQYDKIRLMPFGEYVPLPRWLPGAGSVRSIVGEFTPGSSYTLMPLGALRAGAFICIEAAHPSIARQYTENGADVLINISNDGYLGPTAVMRQHLSNAIFRAVENDRPLLRVTNNGISAFIRSNGQVADMTPGFQPAVRTWGVGSPEKTRTFYTRHGDVFAYLCAVISLAIIGFSIRKSRNIG